MGCTPSRPVEVVPEQRVLERREQQPGLGAALPVRILERLAEALGFIERYEGSMTSSDSKELGSLCEVPNTRCIGE